MIRTLVRGILLLGCSSGVVWAQVGVSSTSGGGVGDLSTTNFDPDSAAAISPISVVEGPGVKIGEGTVIHPVFGIETGFVSNVFYNPDAKPAGVLRLLAQIGTASLNQDRLNPNGSGDEADQADNAEMNIGDFQYHANVRLAYDQMLSGDTVVTNTGGLGVGAAFRGMVNPMGTFSFGFDEDFSRLIRASNFETSSNVNRDINNLRVLLLVHPRTSSLSSYFYYQNALDVFESSNGLYPDRMDHRFGAHPMWRLFPQTVLFADISAGYISGIGSTMASAKKVSSIPVNASVGISTLLTIKTTLNAAVGYAGGFYSSGSSFNAPFVDVSTTFRYSQMGKVGIGYNLAYTDSINANFYRDHVVRGFVEHLFTPFAVLIQPEVHLREYQNTTVMSGTSTTRDDTIFAVIAGVHYNFRNWMAATIDYKFSTIQTDFRYRDVDGNSIDPSYVRHELLAGLRFAM